SGNTSIAVSSLNTSISDQNEMTMTFEDYVRIIVPTIFGVICVLGVFGNSMVIIVVLTDKHMRNTTNILILSLAVADLLFLVCCVPFTAVNYAINVWPFGNFGCKLIQYAKYVTAYASVYTLVIMTISRYIAVVMPLRSLTLLNTRNTLFAILFIWIIILSGNSPIFLQFGELHYEVQNETRSACLNVQELEDPVSGQVFFGFFFVIGYFIPLAAITFLYGRILIRLRCADVPGDCKQSRAENIRMKRSVTKMVSIVVIVFAVCWMPLQIMLFAERFGAFTFTDNKLYTGILFASTCLAYVNSCVNPILYAFLSDSFRQNFKRLLFCKRSSR
ncbi:unnamed protein product, partial [Lymnaea stagnalis]